MAEYPYNNEILPPEVVESLQKAVNAFSTIGEELVKAFAPAVNAMTKLWHVLYGSATCINSKVYYLSKHSKKARVRKKNRNRLMHDARRNNKV